MQQAPLQRIATDTLVFLLSFASAWVGVYIYRHFQTSPAIIFPLFGIAVSVVMFGGYRTWLPLFLGQFAGQLLWNPANGLIVGITAAAYAFQAVSLVYVIERLGFQPKFENLRNMQIFIAGSMIGSMIGPAIATFAQLVSGTLTADPLINWSRAWAGGIFAIIIFVPFVATWFPYRATYESLRKIVEISAAMLLLLGTNFLLFWTPYAGLFGISVIFFLPAVLSWFALRFSIRWMTLGLFLTSVIGVAGSIIAQPSPVSLNIQLLSDEVYIALTAAIFLVFGAVVEERRTAFSTLQKAYDTVAEADKSKTEFIAVLAHELRNPLAPIVSALELLKIQPQTHESAETIGTIDKHVDMIKRLLEDLLDTARLAQRKLKLKKERTSLQRVISDSIASVHDFAHERHHQIRLAVGEDITLVADPVRLKQIFINLLNNACKFMEMGGIIDVSYGREGSEAVIRVADTGVGMTDDAIKTLFQPFKQFNNSSGRGTGLGIGLHLAQRIAEMHGGHITASSKGPQRGSIFEVRLPAQPRGAAQQQSARASANAPQDLDLSARILLVDDNEAAADNLQKLLRHRKLDVATAYSGRAALTTLEEFSPDVIFLDIGLPDMSGYDVAKEIRSRGWGGKIIALTGYGQESDRAQSKNAGFDHHLVKPVAVNDLISFLDFRPQVVPNANAVRS